jgi:hypothetical protein
MVATVLLLCGQANAEPYLAAQMGLKCAQCHVNPTGGGLRSIYGNTFAQTVLARKRIGAAEDLWTGQVMKFLSVGGNARANQLAGSAAPESTNAFEVEEARAYFDFSVIPNRLRCISTSDSRPAIPPTWKPTCATGSRRIPST